MGFNGIKLVLEDTHPVQWDFDGTEPSFTISTHTKKIVLINDGCLLVDR